MLYILSFERRRAQAFFSEFSSNFFHLQTQHQHRSRCGGDTPAQRNVTHIWYSFVPKNKWSWLAWLRLTTANVLPPPPVGDILAPQGITSFSRRISGLDKKWCRGSSTTLLGCGVKYYLRGKTKNEQCISVYITGLGTESELRERTTAALWIVYHATALLLNY